jgi:hypothetical protein
MRWAQRAPFSSQVAVATTKTIAADIVVQTAVEGKSLQNVDYRRVGVFGAFGFLYLGVVQYGLYVKGMQRVFDKAALEKFCSAPIREKIRDKVGLQILAGTIALDFFLIQPLLYWPAYYLVKEVGFSDTSDTNADAHKSLTADTLSSNTVDSETVKGGDGSVLGSALSKYKTNFCEDNLGMCGFWLPMDIIIYSVPIHLRLHLNHIISFAWVGIVSMFRGDADDENENDLSTE